MTNSTTNSVSNTFYLHNPQIHADRRLGQSASTWVQSFSCEDVKPLIICRGPIRKEAMDVFDEMGVSTYGILLSEKDSITYTNALAPELRKLTDPNRVHRVPDYSGATKEERVQRINQIVAIAKDNGYNAIFAGYGFMSEDAEMVQAMEDAGLKFIGPGSFTQRSAGLKDQAKRTALKNGVSVTPGINNATTLAVLAKYTDLAGLKRCVQEFKLAVDAGVLDGAADLDEKVAAVLSASFAAGVDIISVDDVANTLKIEAEKLFRANPNNRFRLKAISGGGGKGQRILQAANTYSGSLEEQIKQASDKTPALVREVLAEVKCNGVGDNKNVLIEMNVETTRHQEIQVVGNGDWCITLGGRDCSLQMHEQKLLEVSVIHEDLVQAHAEAEKNHRKEEAAQLKKDIATLQAMEEEGVRFGNAVGLNSVATFECIVDGDRHYFMEMNTRIQVEHRVTELCYKLKFTNPNDPADFFIVESLVEVMVLLSRYGKALPKPERIVRDVASVEARLNATNQALQPHAGGLIEYWSNVIDGEIRDDQGISLHNPDTDVFMKYHLAGAYDSNIALLLTTGNTRLDSYKRMAEVLRRTELRGKDLSTNLEFHYGLVNWFIGQNVNARPTTKFIVPYLTAVGLLKQATNNIDLSFAWSQIRASYIKKAGDDAKHWAQLLDRKQSLFLRPLEQLFAEPHILSGWLSLNQRNVQINNGVVSWLKNPIELFDELYHFLHMDFEVSKPAAFMIWDHDHDVLSSAVNFYSALKQRLGLFTFADVEKILAGNAPEDFTAEQWQAAQAAHMGYQAASEILAVLPYVAEQTGFFNLKVNADLTVSIPENLLDTVLQEAMAKILVPPPMAKSDEILSVSGGMFYSREAPGMDVYVSEGSHFKKGDPLYIVEVMKMFNKVYAEFDGTIEKILVDTDGTIIKKGQPLFKITPDEKVVVETPEQIASRRKQATAEFLKSL